MTLALTLAFLWDRSPAAAWVLCPPDTLTLDLRTALSLAQDTHAGIRAAAAEVTLLSGEARAVWMGRVLPRVSVDLLETGYGGQLTRRFVDFVGNPVDNPDASWIRSSSTYQGVELTWLLRGPSPFDALTRQKGERRNRELALSAVQKDVAYEVEVSWFRVQRETERLQVERELFAMRETEQSITERRFRLAGASRLEMLAAELAVERQRLAVRAAEHAVSRAHADLLGALGDPELSGLQIIHEPLPVLDPEDIDEEGLLAHVRTQGVLVRAAELRLHEARLDETEARRWRWPTLRASYVWGRFRQGRDAGALADLGFDRGDVQSRFALTLALPWLEDPAGALMAEAKARVALERTRDELGTVRAESAREVQRLIAEVRERSGLLAIMDHSVGLAAEALSVARAEYAAGVGSFEQLQEAVMQDVILRRDLIEARHDLVAVILSLEHVTGRRVRGGRLH